jgi:hypothetical protein
MTARNSFDKFVDKAAKTAANFFRWMYRNITWFITGILIADTLAFTLVKNGLVLAFINGIILFVLVIRLWRDTRANRKY